MPGLVFMFTNFPPFKGSVWRLMTDNFQKYLCSLQIHLLSHCLPRWLQAPSRWPLSLRYYQSGHFHQKPLWQLPTILVPPVSHKFRRKQALGQFWMSVLSWKVSMVSKTNSCHYLPWSWSSYVVQYNQETFFHIFLNATNGDIFTVKWALCLLESPLQLISLANPSGPSQQPGQPHRKPLWGLVLGSHVTMSSIRGTLMLNLRPKCCCGCWASREVRTSTSSDLFLNTCNTPNRGGGRSTGIWDLCMSTFVSWFLT